MNPWECPNCKTIYAGWVDRCKCKKTQTEADVILEKLKSSQATIFPVCDFCKQRHSPEGSCFKYYGFCVPD